MAVGWRVSRRLPAATEDCYRCVNRSQDAFDAESSATIADRADIFRADSGTSHTAFAATEQSRDLPYGRVGRKKTDQQGNRQVTLVFAARTPTVRDEAIVFLIEAQWVLNPADSNIASHLSLPHRESVGIRNVLRPTRADGIALLYEWPLALIVLIVADLGVDRLDRNGIIISRTVTRVLTWRVMRPLVTRSPVGR